ncbi:hypothetical protein U732_1129 [Clostridium argentinense CDC 2741]|uniref:Uncharacterized protein n=1 Tax=Clostridium argentinense CDC 2741 TaxID=1418104 RepID=A0A0C1U5C9_9CLOT|nr:hypothetical protein [Clostridium argentinense]KIE46938.1 hypothetical protein U732_1129 [Clostridium argentinense CDC 2741]NFF40842.1 hypothetical protein [Clostridium argentinense]NFP50774.1 hypothetical protein [Clostridium argentinense]NFP73069.1 hypothetical protein [Clostridium argentinense]NFP77921.1 hypothetical protein [Clostridium argentinense]
MRQNDFRKPVVYILDQELRKRDLRNKIRLDGEKEEYKGDLPQYPCRLVRDESKKVIKCIYAENTGLQWEEELIRNIEGKVYRIKTTYPDGNFKTIELFKNIDGKVETIKYV